MPKDAPDPNATFIFVGVAKKGGSKGAAGVLTTVETVLRAPHALADSAGNDVLVVLPRGDQLKPGERSTFYSNPVRWGELVTVQATARVPVAAPTAGARRGRSVAATPPAFESLADQKLREQVAKADVVVSGIVSAVRLPDQPATPPRARRGVATPAPPRKISEHDPMWREAVIDVKATHKGETPKQLLVRFPKSNDVRWKHAPKFQPGEEGVFLLRQDQVAQPATATAPRAGRRSATAAAAPDASYTALTPTDVQPLDREEQIKNLIRAPKS